MNIHHTIQEARRQIEICNACRYCEGFCSVFPAITRERQFTDGDVIQLANLCHNCRGCYYACQYTEPHEFDLNVPKIFAEVRHESWQLFTRPTFLSLMFQKNGVAVTLLLITSFILLFSFFGQPSDELNSNTHFYDVISHDQMVTIFSIAFITPILLLLFSIRLYWKTIAGKRIQISHLIDALKAIFIMKDLSGGHGKGCNFEQEDRYTNQRRIFHQLVMYGFLLCFLATSVATLMHYLWQIPAPYHITSLPKLFGLSGGVLLCVGTIGMTYLKMKSDRFLTDSTRWGGEMAFIGLLFFVSASGLVLYIGNQSAWLPELLIIHLSAVLTFFLIIPFSKMVHGFYRMTAIIRDVQHKTIR